MARCSLSSNTCSDQRRHAPQADALFVNRELCHLQLFVPQVRVMTSEHLSCPSIARSKAPWMCVIVNL